MSPWRDLRYAFRTLARRPGFTAIALLALTLGMGANAVVFTDCQHDPFQRIPLR